MTVRYNFIMPENGKEQIFEVEFECKECGYADSAIGDMATALSLLYDSGWKNDSISTEPITDRYTLSNMYTDSVLCAACYAKRNGVEIDTDW